MSEEVVALKRKFTSQKFCGEITTCSACNSAVHDNNAMAVVDKFNYLRALLIKLSKN